MSKTLSLYRRGFNEGEKTHFLFSSKLTYINYLSANFSMATLTLPNYQITNGEVRISLSYLSQHNELDPYECVYMGVLDTEVNSRSMFYKVTRAYERSGYVVYEVTPDLWACFLDNVQFSQIHVNRCNRNIANGVYDEVKHTKGADFYQFYNEINANDNYFIVFSCAVVTHTNWLGSDPITQTFLFACEINDLPPLKSEFQGYFDVVDKVRVSIGGIYETTAYGTAALSQHAEVIKCWLVPKDFIKLTGVFTGMHIASPFLDTSNNNDSIKVYIVKMDTKEITFSLDSLLNGSSQIINSYPRYMVGFGAKNNYMPLIRDTQTGIHSLCARCYIDTDVIKIEVCQGDNRKDLTDAFEVECSINNQMGTSTEAGARNMSKLVGVAGTGLKALALMSLGTPYAIPAGIAAGAQGVASFMQPQHNSPSSPAVGNGSAGSSLSCGSATKLLNPFGITIVESANDENKHAYYKGANFNAYIDSFASAEACDHLGYVTGNGRDGTFISCDSVQIDGVNGEAEEYIRNELGRGIWVKTLS